MGFVFSLAMAAASGWIVNVPVANLYSASGADADVVSQAIYATSLTELDSHSGWLRIGTADGYRGWVARSSVTPMPEAGYPAGERTLLVSSIFANLYREPDVTRHQPLLTVPYETRLEVLAEPRTERRRWIQVRLPDDRDAWVLRGDVSFSREPLSVNETIALARRFLGLPYLWGGVSSFGFDCSGFTQMLCRRRGIAIPRDAGPQSRFEAMPSVDCADLQPGDLLFFGKSLDQVVHTGMYIGNGSMIHATARGQPVVQISRLDKLDRPDHLVACRRPMETK